MPLNALGSRNFRLFFSGQSVSLVGTWMTRLAVSWLVYRLTHSPFLLGLVSFVGQVPTFLLAPIAGVWVDRLNRRRVLILTQAVLAALAFGIAALTLAGRASITALIVFSVLQGFVYAFDIPGRSAFLLDMVEDRTVLANAIALNSSMVNFARLAGPSLAGVTIAAVGEGWCFAIDGASYLAVIASLVAMRVAPRVAPRQDAHPIAQLKEGWTYVSSFAPARTLLLMYTIVSLVAVPYTVLMPAFAAGVLHAGANTLGLLLAANGVGALLSAVRLALRRSATGLYKVITLCAILFGVAQVAFAGSRTLGVSVILLALCGYGSMQAFTAIGTVIQTIVPDDKRGRVMSYWTMSYMGAGPIGSVLAGALAGVVGTPWALAICGAAALAGAAWFWSERHEVRGLVRPIYQDLGLLPRDD